LHRPSKLAQITGKFTILSWRIYSLAMIRWDTTVTSQADRGVLKGSDARKESAKSGKNKRYRKNDKIQGGETKAF